jgi:hypothetical protein
VEEELVGSDVVDVLAPELVRVDGGIGGLEQYSLMAFLDRFIYREAKKSTASRGSSMMQPGVVDVLAPELVRVDGGIGGGRMRALDEHDAVRPVLIREVLSGDAISATSDLEQYSLMAFLDRFIYREAKKSHRRRSNARP